MSFSAIQTYFIGLSSNKFYFRRIKNEKIRTFFASALSCLLLTSAIATAFIGCDSSKKGDENKNDPTNGVTSSQTTEAETEKNESETNPPSGESNGKVEYTVSVQTIGGRPVSDLTFHIYKGDDLTAYGETDENGIGKVMLTPADNYTIELSTSKLEGYNVEARYSFEGNAASITLTSSVIADTDLTGVNYKLGDIMRDFSVTTTDGTEFKLSEALKTKKAVLINFWYSTCSPCINEFPYMQSAYEKFSDDIEVIALNNYYADTENTVKDFKAAHGLTFPVAKDYSALGTAFNLQGYPTSIIVDRYGTICLIEIGGLTSEKPFVAAFEHFTSENYQQQLLQSIDALTPTEKPDVEMPSSEEIGAAFNGEGFTATYAPEVDSSDAEYSWPFITGKITDGGKEIDCVYPSNAYKDLSFATLHATVELKAGEALAFDYFANTELGADILYIMVEGVNTYRISGISTEWQTCFPYVAVKDGTYKVSFIYLKDGDTDAERDTVYLKNLRKVNADDVTTETYIPREAATEKNANGLGYQKYITPVFNEKDGYYHVNSEDGPILLVNLMDKTQLSETSLNLLGYQEVLVDDMGNIYTQLERYCNFAINGTLYGYSPVTEELRGLLERAADIIGFEAGNPNQWLQACTYYDAYGTEKQLEDPVKGIAFFAAFDAIESTETEEIFNTVTYDGRVIMPRGLKYKFVPQKSGTYIIKSQSKDEVNGWIFDGDENIIHTAEIFQRPFGGQQVDTTNVTMIVYLEAGKTYYIDIAYYDVYGEGTFTFTLKYLAESYEQFYLASPGYFTYHESTTGQINETIAGGINVALGDDGYYHELRADGTLGSIVYADFTFSTGLFSHSIQQMIEMGGFNFALSDTDQTVLAKLNELKGDKEACLKYYKELWGESYAEWEEIYKLEEVLAGIYHGNDKDLTEDIKAYMDKKIAYSEDHPELEGCVPVDAGLASLLQKIMDKYSFSGVRNSWTKLCYYYKSFSSTNN